MPVEIYNVNTIIIRKDVSTLFTIGLDY